MAESFKNKTSRNRVVQAGLFCLGLAAIAVGNVCGVEPVRPTSPTVGDWKGFRPGDYVVQKRIYRGLSYRKDGEEYRKTVLLSGSKEGRAVLYSFVSDTAEGPWKPGKSGWTESQGTQRASVEKKELPSEAITVGDRAFPCRVTLATMADDWGTTTRKHWIDKTSGLDLKRVESFEGQHQDGRHYQWKLTRLTRGLETVTVGTNRFVCFVQEQKQTIENADELTWQERVTAEVPGYVVMSSYSAKKDGPPEIETTLVILGHDSGLIAEYERLKPTLGISTDEDYEQRKKAEAEERKRESDELTKTTIGQLKSPDEPTRAQAARSLSEWFVSEENKNAILEALKGALDDPAAAVRRQAVLGVGKHGIKGTAEQILDLMRRDPEGADFYLKALGLQEDPKGLPTILEHLSSTNPVWRSASAVALGNFKTDEARLALEKIIDDPNGNAPFGAVESLMKIGDPRSVPAFIRVLRYRDPVSVQFAVRAIVKLGDDSAVPALLELLDSPNEMSRMAVCAYIGKMKLKDTRPVGDALLKKLDDPSQMVRSTATQAVGELRERRAVPKLLAIAQRPAGSANDWFKPNLASVAALGKIGDPAAVPGLVKMLDDPSQHQHQFVCNALAQLGESAAPPLLADFLRATNEAVQLHSLNALSEVGTKETVVTLQEYLVRCPPPQKRVVRETIQKIEQRLSR